MATTTVKMPRDGFFPILFWVLKNEPWRVLNLSLGIIMSILFGIVFFVISNHFPEEVQTVHLPPVSYFDWVFIFVVGVYTIGVLSHLLISCLSWKLAWSAFLGLLIRVALYLALEFVLWPVRILFVWVGSWPFMQGAGNFLSTVYLFIRTPAFPPTTASSWVSDIFLVLVSFYTIMLLIGLYAEKPQVEEPLLRLGLFVPILVRKYIKAKAANNLTLANTYLEKAREVYAGAEVELQRRSKEAAKDLFLDTLKTAADIQTDD